MRSTSFPHVMAGAALASCLLVAVAGCQPGPKPAPVQQAAPEETAAGEAEIEIAVLLDLSGSQGSLGKPAWAGFQLALRERTDADRHLVKVIHRDTETNDRVTMAAARELAPSTTVGAGFTNNESLLVAGPIFQDANKPFLSIGATDPALPAAVGNRIFLACFGDNAQAAAAAEFAQREFGDTTFILWDESTSYTRMLPKYFRARFDSLGGNVLGDESFSGNDLTELGQQIGKLPQQPSFIYLAALPEKVGETIASLRAAGVQAPIIGGDGLDTPNVLASESGPTTNVWFTTHAWLSAETGSPAAKEFVQAYEKAYGEPPQDAFAALGYDSANLLLDAIKRAEGASPDQIQAALAATRNFQGVTGEISYGDGSHLPQKTVWILHVEAGRKSLATSLIPASTPPPILADQQ